MQTPEFAENLVLRIEQASCERVAPMCAKAVPCAPRSLIAGARVVHGIHAEEIITAPRPGVHTLTRFAKTDSMESPSAASAVALNRGASPVHARQCQTASYLSQRALFLQPVSLFHCTARYGRRDAVRATSSIAGMDKRIIACRLCWLVRRTSCAADQAGHNSRNTSASGFGK
ncbi:hypothetical protein SBC1_74460 (plasmid) [Caballeronia sp. SBC1]|nr:hypothetical protein SBC2_71830 [Caballeronia sp. SBC2]QIN67399.1 hypothetical protein SBC1_74460 [Caballeronia sp. SBC1]